MFCIHDKNTKGSSDEESRPTRGNGCSHSGCHDDRYDGFRGIFNKTHPSLSQSAMLRWSAWYMYIYMAITPSTAPADITTTPVLKTKPAATRHSATCSVPGTPCRARCACDSAALFTAARATSLPTPLPQLARRSRSRTNAMLGSAARPKNRPCAPGESATEYSLRILSRNAQAESLRGATSSDTSLSLLSWNDRFEYTKESLLGATSSDTSLSLLPRHDWAGYTEDHGRHEVVTEVSAASL